MLVGFLTDDLPFKGQLMGTFLLQCVVQQWTLHCKFNSVVQGITTVLCALIVFINQYLACVKKKVVLRGKRGKTCNRRKARENLKHWAWRIFRITRTLALESNQYLACVTKKVLLLLILCGVLDVGLDNSTGDCLKAAWRKHRWEIPRWSLIREI